MTVNTIFKYARDNGWQRPRAAPERVPLENVVSDSSSADGRDLPVIEVGFDEMRIVDEVVTALMDRPNLYQRGGLLVEVRESPEPPPCIIRPEGGVRVVTIPKYRLREIITDSVRFVRKRDGKDGEPALKDVRCPQTAVEQVLARGFWRGFKTIEGVVSAPQFLLDGSVLGVTGYHPRSGLFFESSPGVVFPAVPDRPTKQDAERARDQLLEVVCDMPLDQISRAGWIALALTCVARHAIAGPTPLFVIDANTRGTGKSLAADAVGIIATGRELPRTTWTNDNAECRKMITAVLLAAEPITLLDNIGTVLGNPPLDALLTSATWTDRVLGVSEMTAKLPATTIWSASGNNILLAADTARRTLRIRLESLEENPEERSGFKHPNLLGWVRQHRCRLAVAAVTILRAWHVAGRPDMGLPPWGSFESWSGVIRNATVWVGLADPGASRQVLQCESDREAILLRQILQAWYEADPNSCGLTVGDAISMAEKGDGGLAAVFAELAGPNGKPNVRSVGMKFHHLRGRVCGGMYLDKRPTNRGAAWLIRFAECDAKSGETSGTKDTSDTNPGHPVGARKHTHAGAHVVGAGASVTCVPSVTECEHIWVDRQSVDGVARSCSKCGKFYGFVRGATEAT